MNMAYDYSSDNEFENNRELDHARGGKEKLTSHQRERSFSKGKKAPSQFNGIHRRRNKRHSW